MAGADDLRRERNAENRDQDRYACGDCGLPSETDDRACPECGGTDIVPTREISSPAFGE
jgi:rubrerythrin